MTKKKQVSVNDLKKKQWLFDKKEVKMTGRVSEKHYGRQKQYLFEIYYPNTQNNTVKQWVRLEDLWLVRSASETVYIPTDLIDAIKKAIEEE